MAVDDENFLHDFSILSKYQTGRIELSFHFSIIGDIFHGPSCQIFAFFYQFQTR